MRRLYVLLPLAFLGWVSCSEDSNYEEPPQLSPPEERCCREVLKQFEEDQMNPQPDSAIACVVEAVDQLPDDYPETSARCLYALGYQESTKRDYERSNSVLLQAEALLADRRNRIRDSLLADIYNLLSINYQLQSEYTRTLAFSEKAEALYRKMGAWERLVDELNNQAVCYLQVGDLQAAEAKVSRAESIISDKTEGALRALTRLNLENNKLLLAMREGDVYSVIHWPERAIPEYSRALSISDSLLAQLNPLAEEAPRQWMPYLVNAQFSRATLLSKMVDSLGTPPFRQQVEGLLELTGEPNWDTADINPFTGYLLLMMAKALALDGELEKADKFLQLSLQRLGYPNKNIMESPPVQMDLPPRQDFLLSAIQVKGLILNLHHAFSNKPQLLDAALDNYRQGIIFLDSIRILQVDDAAAEGARRIANGFLADAIRTAYALYELAPSEERLRQLFQLAEEAKSYTVRQAVFRRLGFMELESEMQTLLQREQELRRNMQYYKQKGLPDSVLITTAQYKAFIENLRSSDNPVRRSYYQERFSNDNLNWQRARRTLDDTTAVLSFVHATNIGLCFVLTAQGLEVVELPMEDGRIAATASALKANLQSGSLSTFPRNAHRLYQLALSDAVSRLPKTVRRLVIVPDGALHGLPFECLLTKQTWSQKGAEQPYLLNKYWISYMPSVSIYESLKELPNPNPAFEIGLFWSDYEEGEAAGNSLRCDDYPLEKMIQSSENIYRRFRREGYNSQRAAAAGEAAFKRKASQCRILHLAAHACVNARLPGDYAILFTLDKDKVEDGNLQVEEILSLRLDSTELVVLSMCNTQAGVHRPGEGLLSIARAFSIAGCSSLLASTIRSRQAPVAFITSEFYDLLLAGKPKDVALAEAKRRYLRQHRGAEPAEWAPLILMGNHQPMY